MQGSGSWCVVAGGGIRVSNSSSQASRESGWPQVLAVQSMLATPGASRGGSPLDTLRAAICGAGRWSAWLGDTGVGEVLELRSNLGIHYFPYA